MKRVLSVLSLQVHYDREQGFSMVEVLVGVGITLIFTGAVLQAVVIATIFQASAQELREASGWIQEDLETLKFKSNRLNWDDVENCYKDLQDPLADCQTQQAACRATAITNGFATLLKTRLTYLDPNIVDDTALDPNDAENNNVRQSDSSQRTYTLSRTTTPSNIPPFDVLEIEYTVMPASGGLEITQLSTAVLPDASLACL